MPAMLTPQPTPALEDFPRWGTTVDASSWERVKEALRSDWEQTRAQFSTPSGRGGEERGEAERLMIDWGASEQAMRYGFAARVHFRAHGGWCEEVESLLALDWDGAWGQTWDQARSDVRRGWDSACREG